MPALRWPATGLFRAARRGDVDRLAGLAGLLPQGRGDATWPHDLGKALGSEWVRHPATWIVAADLTGRRVAFGSPRAPKARLGTVAGLLLAAVLTTIRGLVRDDRALRSDSPERVDYRARLEENA